MGGRTPSCVAEGGRKVYIRCSRGKPRATAHSLRPFAISDWPIDDKAWSVKMLPYVICLNIKWRIYGHTWRPMEAIYAHIPDESQGRPASFRFRMPQTCCQLTRFQELFRVCRTVQYTLMGHRKNNHLQPLLYPLARHATPPAPRPLFFLFSRFALWT
jgi:hypothetical protein